jgi:hypothetical protein
MDIEQALMTYLLAQSGLTALVSTRIHYDELPQDSALPAVCIIHVSDVKAHTLTGQSKLEQPSYQFTVYASSKATARAVANQIKTALADYHGTMSGLQVQSIQMQNEMSGMFKLPDGTVKINTIDLEFEVSFVKE